MRLAVVSTYAPKACGIAVFSGDVRTAMLAANRGCRVDVVAMIDEGVTVPTGPELLTTIARNDPASYRAAAEVLAATDVDVVVLEHEFGLFGGPAGDAVLAFAAGPPPAAGRHSAHGAFRAVARSSCRCSAGCAGWPP